MTPTFLAVDISPFLRVDTAGFYLTGALLLLACLLRLPAVVRARGRDWLLSSICALLLVGSGVLVTAAPQTIAAVNQATGITNIAAPLVYALLDTFSGASVVLVLNWRGGDQEQTRRLSKAVIITYSVICLTLFVLYALGDDPVEKRFTFDTYYANTPYLREMISLYLVAHAVASTSASILCWRWSKDEQVSGILRTGLRILASGYLLHVGYDLSKGVAVAARWTGTDWDVLSTKIAPVFAQPSALLVAIGFILPLVGAPADDLYRYFRLGRLAREMQRVEGAPAPTLATYTRSAWRVPLSMRLTQRQTFISDRLVACYSHLDPGIRDQVYQDARQRNVTDAQAAAVADAAMIVEAVESRRSSATKGTIPPAASHTSDDAPHTGDLAAISRAMRSPVVKAIRRRAREESASLT
ncbi:DUF6545 domain-containing protein [Streptomyces mirabilis]|uniref:DUF6545 domain-containing protein n=1 Tax=Streptomyces mirabilis TaxID=68239 RepID=UPI0036917BA7